MSLEDRVFDRRGWISAAVLLPLCVAVAFSPPWFGEGSWFDVVGDLVAWLLLAGGVFLRLWATLYLGGRKSIELVTAGPYAVCRNPLYVASFLIILSLSVFLMSLSILVTTVTLAIFYALVIVPSEERHALACFGAAYGAYVAATPRFLPRSLRFARPGWIEIKAGEFLREYARAYGLIALGAAADVLAYCRTQPWWPTVFHLP